MGWLLNLIKFSERVNCGRCGSKHVTFRAITGKFGEGVFIECYDCGASSPMDASMMADKPALESKPKQLPAPTADE